MESIQGYHNIPQSARPAVVAIGNFDGVHLGHRKIITVAKAQANRLSLPLSVMTFDPHPREYFFPQAAPFRLMNKRDKNKRLQKLGVDYVYDIPFTRELADLPAFTFADRILHQALDAKHVVVGENFCFGKGRCGCARDLVDFGGSLGFATTVVPFMCNEQDQQISSTAIRTALSRGLPKQATTMLGHFHAISGTVIKGRQRGRHFDYPTANLSLDGLHVPRLGVYACYVESVHGAPAGIWKAITAIGTRPMFGNNTPNCETFIFNFHHTLYGCYLSVFLVDFLREEKHFATTADLLNRMQVDCIQAVNCLLNPAHADYL